jgi:hypothetical protein
MQQQQATMSEEEDILFIMIALQSMQVNLDEQAENAESLLIKHIRIHRRLNRSLPAEKKRLSWESFTNRISVTHFRCMFRMTQSSFDKLCSTICAVVGEETFWPEAFLKAQEQAEDNMSDEDEEEKTFHLILGKVKVALSLQMLAGGSYLDLVPLFDVSKSHLYKTFHAFVKWVLMAFSFSFVRMLREESIPELVDCANHFT